MSDVCGVIPVFSRGELGTPYPAALYSVEPGYLLIDYALEQLAQAGIVQAILPVTSRDLPYFASVIGKERRDVAIQYLEVVTAKDDGPYPYIVRGCRLGEYRSGYSKFVILSPTFKALPGTWLRDTLQSIEPPAHLGITDCLYLTDDCASDLRRFVKAGTAEEGLAQILGNRYAQPSEFWDFSKWSEIQRFHKEMR